MSGITISVVDFSSLVYHFITLIWWEKSTSWNRIWFYILFGDDITITPILWVNIVPVFFFSHMIPFRWNWWFMKDNSRPSSSVTIISNPLKILQRLNWLPTSWDLGISVIPLVKKTTHRTLNETGLQQGHLSKNGWLWRGRIQETEGGPEKRRQKEIWKTWVGLLSLVSTLETLSWDGREEDKSSWNGKNHMGQVMPPGTYLMHMEASNFQTGKTTIDVAPVVIGIKNKWKIIL